MREATQSDEGGINYDEIAPRDVIGFHVFNCETGMGNGKVIQMKTVNEEPHFVCETGDSTVNRPVEQVMRDLREFGHDLCTEPWTVAEPEEVGEMGVDEAEIAERASESWSRLADEFGLTESAVRDIVINN